MPQSDAYSLLVIPSEMEAAFREKAQKMQYAGAFTVLYPDGKCEETVEDLHMILERLLQWEHRFMEGILKSQDARELLSSLPEVLPLDFCVSDIDMNLLYRTDGYAHSRSLTADDHFPTDVFQDLISHREFHEAAKKKEMFYYYTSATDTTSYCSNIFAGEKYVGRLVILLPAGQDRLSKGGEELCRLLAEKVQTLFNHQNLTPGRHADDAMHRLCRSLSEESGASVPSASEVSHILRDYGWMRGDIYSTIVLNFTTEPGWDAHLSLTLPYLALEIERNRMNFCAVSFDTEILMIVNHTQDPQKEDRHTFLQRIAYFVRENICKAGVSPYYTDFLQLKYALKAAEAALRLGTAREPHLWYYLFDDLRLPFMMERLCGMLPTSMMIHPAVGTLMDYDAEHDSELARTLQVYLKSNLNMTAAADALFIHRTSFCRRMNHIRKLTGLNLEDPDTILVLLISYHLLNES